jgi:hypothetical protein
MSLLGSMGAPPTMISAWAGRLKAAAESAIEPIRLAVVSFDFNMFTTSSWNFKLQDFPNVPAVEPKSLTVRGSCAGEVQCPWVKFC